MPNIEKNSFYRSNLISGAVALNPRLKDFPSAAGDATYELKGGFNSTLFVLSGNVAATPAFGSGKLKGGWLRTFCTGLSISGSAELPKINVFNMEEGVYVTEPDETNGWTFPSTIDANVAVYSSQFDADEAWLGEYFDGADKSLGAIQSLGNTPGGNLSLKDVYVEPKEGADEIFIGGDAFGFGMPGISNDVQENLIKYFSTWTFDKATSRIYVRPLKKSRMKGLWTATIDAREGVSKWAVYAPYWKWKKLQPILRFGSAVPPIQTAEELEKAASTSNTIFSHIAKTGDFNNALSMSSTKPFLESVVEISSAQAKTGGSSLRMYHSWSTIPGSTNDEVEQSLGKYFINPQVSKVGIYDLPAPAALDLGTFNYTVSSSTGPALDGGAVTWPATGTLVSGVTQLTGTNFDTNLESGSRIRVNLDTFEITNVISATNALLDRVLLSGTSGGAGEDKMYVLSTELGKSYASGAHLTDKRVVFPEIDITMNIAKLMPSPAINPLAHANQVGTYGRVYFRAGRASGSSKVTKTDADKILTDTSSFSKGGPLTSLLRSCVVTFSSYPPETFDTLDEFIDYGMHRYYMQSDVQDNSQNDTQLCGIVFQRSFGNAENKQDATQISLGIEQDQSLGSVYAYALPVTQWAAVSGSTYNGAIRINAQEDGGSGQDYGHYGLYSEGGMALLDNSASSSIKNATKTTSGIKNIVIQPKYDADYWNPDTRGTCSVAGNVTKTECVAQNGIWTPTPFTNINGSLEPHWVKIPLDDFFTMKFVFDKYASYGGNYNDGSYSHSNYGHGGTYSYRNMETGLPTDYCPTSSDNKSAWGVPIRCYFEGNVTGSTQKGDPIQRNKLASAGPTGSKTSPTAEGGLPYINVPLMWHPLAPNQNAQDFLPHLTSQNKGMVASYPKYMTVWLNNYRYTTYEEGDSDSTNAVFRGAQPLSGSTGGVFGLVGGAGAGAASRDYQWTPARREGADEIAYGNATTAADSDSGTPATAATERYMSPEAEVFIDSVEFKYFNHSITNHSIQAGEMQRFINLENNKFLSPRTTYTMNDVSLGGGVSVGGGGQYPGPYPVTGQSNNRVYTGFRADGKWLPHNPGFNMSIGFKDDPSTYFPVSGTTSSLFPTGSTHDIYLLFNNFSTSQFGRMNQIVPALGWKPSAGRYSAGLMDGQSTNYVGTLGADLRGRVVASGSIISGGSGKPDNRAAWAGTGYTYSPEGAGFSYLPVVEGAGAAYDGNLAFGSGSNTWLSSDGHTQKGFMRMSVDTSYNAVAAGVAQTAGSLEYNSGTDLATGTTGYIATTEIGMGISNYTATAKSTAVITGTRIIAKPSTTTVQMNTDATASVTEDAIVYSSTLIDRWSKSPNQLVAAKILGVQGSQQLGFGSEEVIASQNQIRVDSPQIFAEGLDDTYIIYRIDQQGAPITSGGATQTDANRINSQLGYIYTIKLATATATTNLPDDIIDLVVTDSSDNLVSTGLLKADDGITDLCTSEFLAQLWISPLRYWVNYSFITDELDYRRTYEAVNAINKAPASGTTNALGSTFNEWTYSYNTSAAGSKGQSGFYEKPWVLGNAENSTLILTTDYGYGAYDEETDLGGQVGEATAVLNQYVEANISGIIEGGSGGGSFDMGGETTEDQGLNFAVMLSSMVSQKTVTLVGDDTALTNAEFKPTLIWQFHDALPKASQFSVSPAFNALEADTSLYNLSTQNLNAVKFTWTEEGDDIWYRILMVDKEDIRDKYHKCIFHIPLNESAGIAVVGHKPENPIYKFYDYVGTANNPPDGGYVDTGSSKSSTCLATIEGLAGYAFLGTGSDTTTGVPQIAYAATATSNASKLMTGLEEYTFVLHSIPASTDAGNYLFDQGSNGAVNGFEVYLDANKKVVAKHGDITLQGTSVQICDGESPVNIIVTYVSGSDQGGRQPLELYVNGILEDYDVSTAQGKLTTTSGAVVGGQWTGATVATTWDGLIEEILIYNKRWDIVPVADEYVYNTERLAEKTAYTTGGLWQTQNAKLFLFDYHNIRGRASDLVAQSNLVGWKVTAI